MATDIIMPKLGMTMKEGTVVEWLKKENEPVKKGEAIAVISSDKIEKEIEAPADGVLISIVAQEADVVQVAKPIGYIGQVGEQIELTKEKVMEKIEFATEATENINITQQSSIIMNDKKRIIASPSARKLARSLNIKIERIEGSGPNGRITNADVEKAAGEQAQTRISDVDKGSEAFIEDSTPQIKPVTGMRKIIAERMFQSLQQTAQLTLMIKADVTELVQLQKTLRSQLEDEDHTKLTITDFIAKATIKALASHKLMNSTYVSGEIHQYEEVHLGIAVALKEGLIVPVIRHAEKLSLAEISKQIRSLSLRARQGDLSQSEIQGSTFTITNLGKSGTEYFTPVLNLPESGILGVGTIQATPVFTEENQIVRCDLLPLSLTFDHRVLDGEPASKFLASVKNYLEKPYSLLL